MSKNKKKLIMFTCIYILVLLMITSTFAWFFVNNELEIDYGSEIVCESGSSLELSMYQGIDKETNEELWTDYSGYVKYTGVVPKLEDITGDGKTLYSPTSLETDPETGELTPEGLDVAKKINDEGYGDYIEIDIKLRTISTMNVYLSGNSSVKPVTTSDTNRNVFGNFSKDFIAGALRVAILEKNDDGSEELKMLWAPQPYYELKYDSYYGKYSLDENGNIEEYFYYKYDENAKEVVKYAVTPDDFVSKRFVLGSTKTTESMVNNSPILTTLAPEINQMIEKQLVIRVWFEGTDREANQALSGGQINMNLKFMGIAEKNDTPNENKELIDSIELSRNENGQYILKNITSEIYYSINGYSWYLYTAEQMQYIRQYITNHSEDFNIYFKWKESALEYEYINYITFTYGGNSNG